METLDHHVAVELAEPLAELNAAVRGLDHMPLEEDQESRARECLPLFASLTEELNLRARRSGGRAAHVLASAARSAFRPIADAVREGNPVSPHVTKAAREISVLLNRTVSAPSEMNLGTPFRHGL